MASDRADVVVVGGGLAGIAAATVLAEQGVSVVVIEKEAYLGGRLGAWTDHLQTGEAFEMERGFHAFFRQYYNVRSLLRRVDPNLARLRPLEDYPLLGPLGLRETFSNLPKRAPFNVVELVRRSQTLRVRDLRNVNVRAATQMLSFDQVHTYRRFDRLSAKEYLDSLRFPPAARQLMFDVFAHSFFNPEEKMSAAELLMMFHFYFMGNPEGLVFDVLDGPFSTAFLKPMHDYLEQRGVRFLLGKSVSTIDPGYVVRLDDGSSSVQTDAVVLAMNVPGLKALVETSTAFTDLVWRRSVDSLSVTSPFVVWRLWLDRPTLPERAPFAGTTGFGDLDNISLYHLFEDESRRWAARTGGSVVELHAYAVDDNFSTDELRREMLLGLHALYPETQAAKVVEERWLVRQDCPSFERGQHDLRPTVATPIKNVYLAGDFVKLDVPTALMERAVMSGFLAANHILEARAGTAQPIRHVSTRGLLGSLSPVV